MCPETPVPLRLHSERSDAFVIVSLPPGDTEGARVLCSHLSGPAGWPGGFPSMVVAPGPALLLGVTGFSTTPVVSLPSQLTTFSARSLCSPLSALPWTYSRGNYTQMGPNVFSRAPLPVEK